jgi:hypothetical protein
VVNDEWQVRARLIQITCQFMGCVNSWGGNGYKFSVALTRRYFGVKARVRACVVFRL